MRIRHVLTATAFVLTGIVALGAAVEAAPAAKTHFHRGWLAANVKTKHAWLYVDSEQNNVIAIYDLDALGIPQIGEITDGLVHPTGMAIDASGTLYVANYYGGSISIYPPGATQPGSTITQDLIIPNGLVVDGAGNLYVANKSYDETIGLQRGSAQSSILVFPPGQTSPSAVITSPLIQNPGQLSFDATGDLYLADSATGVSELARGSQQPVALNLEGLSYWLGSVAVDPLDGTMFVCGTDPHTPMILPYASGNTAPGRKLKTAVSADFLTFGDIRHKEYMFAPDSGGNSIAIFAHGARKPALILQTMQYPRATAYKPAGVP
jgi:hypothetical protein